MASFFSEDDDNCLLNNNIEEQDIPSDDHNDDEVHKGLFGDAEEDSQTQDAPAKIEPKKRSVRNPRPRLTVETLCGPRGVHTIEDYFKDIKFKGKGYENNDLDEIIRRLQHWGHRMYPTYKFDDILTNIERLGKKKALHVHMSRYRLGMLENLKALHMNDLEGIEESENDNVVDEPFDEFDALLGEQIAISRLAPRTPSTLSDSKSLGRSSTCSTPTFERITAPMSTPYSNIQNSDERSELATTLPHSPSTLKSNSDDVIQQSTKLTAEQLAKIAENRLLAQERLRARKLNQ